MFKRKYELNERVFDEVNSESAYWIGYLYGDGNCSCENKVRLCCKEQDKELLIGFRNFIQCIKKPIKHFLNNGKYPTVSFEVRSWKFIKALAKYELNKLKSQRSGIHIDLLQDGVSKDFVRGLFDADGSFYYDGLHKNNLYAEITGNMPVLKSIKSILVRHNIVDEGKKIVANGSVFRIRLAKSDCLKLINFMYEGKPRYFLKRKYGLARSYLDRLNEMTLKKSEATVENQYHRPVSEFNKGKKEEFAERKYFTEKNAIHRMKNMNSKLAAE